MNIFKKIITIRDYKKTFPKQYDKQDVIELGAMCSFMIRTLDRYGISYYYYCTMKDKNKEYKNILDTAQEIFNKNDIPMSYYFTKSIPGGQDILRIPTNTVRKNPHIKHFLRAVDKRSGTYDFDMTDTINPDIANLLNTVLDNIINEREQKTPNGR
jgi:hypothetical protein